MQPVVKFLWGPWSWEVTATELCLLLDGDLKARGGQEPQHWSSSLPGPPLFPVQCVQIFIYIKRKSRKRMLIEFFVFSLNWFFLRKEEISSYLSTFLWTQSFNRNESRDDFRLYWLFRIDFLSSRLENLGEAGNGSKTVNNNALMSPTSELCCPFCR